MKRYINILLLVLLPFTAVAQHVRVLAPRQVEVGEQFQIEYRQRGRAESGQDALRCLIVGRTLLHIATSPPDDEWAHEQLVVRVVHLCFHGYKARQFQHSTCPDCSEWAALGVHTGKDNSLWKCQCKPFGTVERCCKGGHKHYTARKQSAYGQRLVC